MIERKAVPSLSGLGTPICLIVTSLPTFVVIGSVTVNVTQVLGRPDPSRPVRTVLTRPTNARSAAATICESVTLIALVATTALGLRQTQAMTAATNGSIKG